MASRSNTQVLFESTEKRGVGGEVKKKRLKDFPIIKCAPEEKILCVQRQHPIALVFSMVLPIIGTIVILVALIFIFLVTPIALPSSLFVPTLATYLLLILISALLVVVTFNFMMWYYQFYIITDKAFLHKHCFRIGGLFSEAVFLEEMHQQNIIRQPQNLLFDFLKIQDVYVYFHELERKEPFIFKNPDNAQEIEDLIQDLTIKHGITRGPI